MRMMRFSNFNPIILTLLLLFSADVVAEDYISVIWRHVQFHPDGSREAVSLPKSYLNLLKKCKVDVSPETRGLFPLDQINCNGVLDFSKSTKFKNSILSLFRRLKEAGIQEIGVLSIDQWIEKISQVKIGVSPWIVFEAATDRTGKQVPRNAAINIDSKNLIILNQQLWKYISEEFQDLLLLHEVIGAAGLGDDENYTLTLKSWWFSLHPERKADYGMHMIFSPDPKSVLQRTGISVVGHGGDFAQILLKASLLHATLRDLPLVDSNGDQVPPQFQPTRKEQEEAIWNALIFSQGTNEMMAAGLCNGIQDGKPTPYECGGFLLKGKTGAPFMLMNREWAAVPDENHRWPLILKLYTQIESQILCSKGYPCK